MIRKPQRLVDDLVELGHRQLAASRIRRAASARRRSYSAIHSSNQRAGKEIADQRQRDDARPDGDKAPPSHSPAIKMYGT